MAKSSRASTRKANNQRLKSKVFGPVEAARAERLSAKLLELAAQPKAQPDAEIKMVDGTEEDAAKVQNSTAVPDADNTMDVDSAKPTSKRSDKKRIEKRRKTSKIVFPKYGDKKKTKRR
ncbi:uncharacterized protein F4812DRAFT_431610 [Daldinia caldariorum]|uniref:uncharacterized protein n=1 Tax=Daldinia caldariorum TaxID=326644 RepID=UPI002008B097|nr:uncharacterized protein F4812DRAFT_431610 [Daldinia caldariorum]KAI1467203.1 hypothetical protein F4812DRAFT_431610 [Daldinia caldariorum]